MWFFYSIISLFWEFVNQANLQQLFVSVNISDFEQAGNWNTIIWETRIEICFRSLYLREHVQANNILFFRTWTFQISWEEPHLIYLTVRTIGCDLHRWRFEKRRLELSSSACWVWETQRGLPQSSKGGGKGSTLTQKKSTCRVKKRKKVL